MQIHGAWRESVEEEVYRRLAERERTIEVQQTNVNQRQIPVGRDAHGLLLAER